MSDQDQKGGALPDPAAIDESTAIHDASVAPPVPQGDQAAQAEPGPSAFARLRLLFELFDFEAPLSAGFIRVYTAHEVDLFVRWGWLQEQFGMPGYYGPAGPLLADLQKSRRAVEQFIGGLK